MKPWTEARNFINIWNITPIMLKYVTLYEANIDINILILFFWALINAWNLFDIIDQVEFDGFDKEHTTFVILG